MESLDPEERTSTSRLPRIIFLLPVINSFPAVLPINIF